ncbi:hypothetical protein DC522_19955 [Microvirga sp. KLBC 81]|uniref:DUF1236 domain-containing protein n=1 Tax=Microvirga sp. KLBC 81 TaxID=1862707 RepID=UPI000D50F28B|nr:DUF1236 domain-containing protein [Microvirga sp. KLBC 81]PVE22700.1 hypothetical protein DC522_19955 [Microvirga sp. KLBC 81]
MRFIFSTAVAALVALPIAAHSQTANQNAGAGAGLATGAVTGAIVGGPVGAVVGGAVGAIAGGALAAPQAAQVQQYVVTQGTPSVRVQEQVVVGQPLPRQVELYAVPSTVGVQTQYRYSVVNDRTVLVDPQTRQVIQVIE